MARVAGSSNGPSKAPKKKKPAPKKKATSTAKAAPKANSKGKKGAAAIPGYKVPKKLLKNNMANRVAGEAATFADVKKMSLAEYNKNIKDLAGKPTTAATKKSSGGSDWDKGAGWVDSQYTSVKDAASKVKKKGQK